MGIGRPTPRLDRARTLPGATRSAGVWPLAIGADNTAGMRDLEQDDRVHPRVTFRREIGHHATCVNDK